MISLAEGMPNELTFPFTEIAIKLSDGSDFVLDGEELAAALQYIPSQGFPPLLQAIKDFQRKAHAPPNWENRDVVIVAGGQDGLSKALEAIIGPGDPILVQNPFYPGANVVISPYEPELIPVEQDEYGIVPSLLRKVLREREDQGLSMPRMMYINPTGANPTGTVMPLSRRKEIYRIACEYNFLLLDDDPYHFMYFTDVSSASRFCFIRSCIAAPSLAIWQSGNLSIRQSALIRPSWKLQETPVSFLSLDTESRVIRIDSFSKVLSSGLRIGVITAAKPLAASIELHMQSSHLHAPTLSQVGG